jgi:hypothetical protein
MDYVEKRRKKSYENEVDRVSNASGRVCLKLYGTLLAIPAIIGLISTIGDDFMILLFTLGFLFLIGWGAVKIIRWILGR